MSGEEDETFNSLVVFLSGPVWNIPILTFIENKSIIFEPDCSDCEEHKKVHEEYKNLVDLMLGTAMEDMGIQPEQFDAACSKASSTSDDTDKNFHQGLFEQVWAADKFEIFQRMMIQNNIELQLQALHILQKITGHVPESYTPIDGKQITTSEEEVMERAVKKSIEAHEAHQNKLDAAAQAEIKDMETALAASLEVHSKLENDRAVNEGMKVAELRRDSITKASAPPAQTCKSDITVQPLEERIAYLQGIKNNLVALKKKEREAQLRKYEAKQSTSRPKSSVAASRAMKGSVDSRKVTVQTAALIERLKREVVNKK